MDGINRINFLRSMYQTNSNRYASEETVELEQIKNELIILNDENAKSNYSVNNNTNSPYLPDQNYYNKDLILGSEKETDWRKVKTEEQAKITAQIEYLKSNQKKLNII